MDVDPRRETHCYALNDDRAEVRGDGGITDFLLMDEIISGDGTGVKQFEELEAAAKSHAATVGELAVQHVQMDDEVAIAAASTGVQLTRSGSTGGPERELLSAREEQDETTQP